MSGEENVLCQLPGGSTEEVWRPSLSTSDGEHVGIASQQATDQSTQARFPEPHTHAGLAGLRGNALLLGETRVFFWALDRVVWTHQGQLKARGRGANRSVDISSWDSNVWQERKKEITLYHISPVLMSSFWEKRIVYFFLCCIYYWMSNIVLQCVFIFAKTNCAC